MARRPEGGQDGSKRRAKCLPLEGEVAAGRKGGKAEEESAVVPPSAAFSVSSPQGGAYKEVI